MKKVLSFWPLWLMVILSVACWLVTIYAMMHEQELLFYGFLFIAAFATIGTSIVGAIVYVRSPAR